VPVAGLQSPFGSGIEDIVPLGAKEEVCRVIALTAIAVMANKKHPRIFAMTESICNSMRKKHAPPPPLPD